MRRVFISAHPAGVSLVEFIVALALFSVLLATTLSFYRQQGTAFTQGNSRMTVMQNLRYGVNSIKQSLRTAGAGLPTQQPLLVYAGVDVLAFNADYATNIENDFFAVYFDPRLRDAEVSALTASRQITIPNTTFQYPSASYFLGSGNSPAETIIFYFDLDEGTSRTDDYVLYRQVNDQPPEVVARRLLRTDHEFFTYYVLDDAVAGSPIREVVTTDLPAAHTEPVHGAPGDATLADEIRAVRVSYASTNGLSGARESAREITRLIRLPNAGLASQPTCGNQPLLGTALAATGVAPTETVAGHIELEWGVATDEASGEQDVIRYVLWRRVGGSGSFGDPIASVSPGAASYVHRDFSAADGVQYSYALAAQDCTPQYSDIITTGTVSWSS